jgi:TPR repeat protein
MTESGLTFPIILVAASALIYFQFFHESGSDEALRIKAEKGDVEAMLTMATKSDSTKDRVLWYKRAADAGSTFGMLKFADYVSALPDKHDVAFHYYLKAAQEGVAEAMAQVAEGYTNGNGVLKNIGSAAEWREKAAKKGHRLSQVELAKALFRNGANGVRPLLVQPVTKFGKNTRIKSHYRKGAA